MNIRQAKQQVKNAMTAYFSRDEFGEYEIPLEYTTVKQDGLTLVPTKCYFRDGKVKFEIGLARGKKNFDKFQTFRKKS